MKATDQRKAAILERIREEAATTVAELAAGFQVSEMTIRRDLAGLQKEGLLKRVHGGAVSGHGRSYEPPYVVRSARAVPEKQRIARAAAALIEPGDSVALDIGSTTFELARNLVDRSGLTVITPSLRILNLLLNTPGIRLIVPGGVIRPGEGSMVGDLAQQAFSELFVDKLFLAVGGIDAESGLTEYNWDDARVKRAMIRSAKEVYLVADAGKFGRTAFARIAGLAEIHALITDQAPPEPLRQSLEASGVRILVAPPAQ